MKCEFCPETFGRHHAACPSASGAVDAALRAAWQKGYDDVRRRKPLADNASQTEVLGRAMMLTRVEVPTKPPK